MAVTWLMYPLDTRTVSKSFTSANDGTINYGTKSSIESKTFTIPNTGQTYTGLWIYQIIDNKQYNTGNSIGSTSHWYKSKVGNGSYSDSTYYSITTAQAGSTFTVSWQVCIEGINTANGTVVSTISCSARFRTYLCMQVNIPPFDGGVIDDNEIDPLLRLVMISSTEDIVEGNHIYSAELEAMADRVSKHCYVNWFDTKIPQITIDTTKPLKSDVDKIITGLTNHYFWAWET